MALDLSLNFVSFRDVSAYAAELTLLVGISILLLHFTFLSTTTSKYSVLIDYSTKASIFLLVIVQYFFWNTLTYTFGIVQMFQNIDYNYQGGISAAANASALHSKTFFHGALLLNTEIVLFKILLIFLSILILFISKNYFSEIKLGYFEYNILFLFSILGCLITISSNDFLTFYVSLEIQALAFYIMATMKKSAVSSEAGLKYFIVGSFSSALLLFGISIIVLITGHHNFDSIQLFLEFPVVQVNYQGIGPCANATSENLYASTSPAFVIFSLAHCIFLGIFLIITAILIKLAVAPFHDWVADIYEGIPTPTALLFATIPKISNFFILVRLIQNVFISFFEILQIFLALICILSLILGSLSAFKQQNIKRFLAFSSVNHFGFILSGLVVGTTAGISASFFYLSFYIILTFGMWTSLIIISYVSDTQHMNKSIRVARITELGGLVYVSPGLALSIFIALLSMGGIPPLAGFNAKIGIFFVLIDQIISGQTFFSIYLILASIALLSSIFSVFYYIRIIKILTFISNVDFYQKYSKSIGLISTNVADQRSNKNNKEALFLLAFSIVFNIASMLLFIS